MTSGSIGDMARPVRNGTCRNCHGRIRHYPVPSDRGSGAWAHMDRADWIHSPHEADPTDESIAAATP